MLASKLIPVPAMTPTNGSAHRRFFRRCAPHLCQGRPVGVLHSVITKQDGSALIETMASVLMLQVLIAAGFAGSYLSFAKVWCDRSAYEASVCLASTTQQKECEQRLRKDFRIFPMGQLDHLTLDRTSGHTRAAFVFKLFDKLEVRAHSELALPLTSFAQHGSIL